MFQSSQLLLQLLHACQEALSGQETASASSALLDLLETQGFDSSPLGLDRGLANYVPGAESGPLPVSTNQVLLKHVHALSSTFCLWLFSLRKGRVSSCDRHCRARKQKYLLSDFLQKVASQTNWLLLLLPVISVQSIDSSSGSLLPPQDTRQRLPNLPGLPIYPSRKVGHLSMYQDGDPSLSWPRRCSLCLFSISNRPPAPYHLFGLI